MGTPSTATIARMSTTGTALFIDSPLRVPAYLTTLTSQDRGQNHARSTSSAKSPCVLYRWSLQVSTTHYFVNTNDNSKSRIAKQLSSTAAEPAILLERVPVPKLSA